MRAQAGARNTSTTGSDAIADCYAPHARSHIGKEAVNGVIEKTVVCWREGGGIKALGFDVRAVKLVVGNAEKVVDKRAVCKLQVQARSQNSGIRDGTSLGREREKEKQKCTGKTKEQQDKNL